jgi:HAD superfamily hydrolase (TIGR01509 family)
MNDSPSADARSAYLLISDCDGVLVNSEVIVERIIVPALERMWGITGLQPVVRPLLGMRIDSLVRAVATSVSQPVDERAIAAIGAEVHAAAVNAPEIAGVRDALAAIPLVKACASNSDHGYVRQVVERTGLSALFGDRLFTADRVPRPKPAPDVYLAAAHSMRVAPERCVVVEDSVTGARAGIAAGMTVLGFVGAAHFPDAQEDKLRAMGAHDVFRDMTQLPALVESWLSARRGAQQISHRYARQRHRLQYRQLDTLVDRVAHGAG